MDISKAKQHVKDAVEAYLATDEAGFPLLDTARQRPIFLVGAPGIGKTAIMSQVASELGIGLVSYSMTHHTRQSALGLPFITKKNYAGFEYEASEYTMSEIVASVYDYMSEFGMERGILFLDEINCVSETLYPSMLQFLQFKTFGRHKIPDGWVVVTAGNPPEYNKSVHEFDIVTLDRLRKISVEPNFDVWRRYAVEKGVHPSIITFLDIKKNYFYSVEASLDGKSFVTARGWDDLSETITIFEKLGKEIDYDLLVQYIQNEKIARDFSSYYDLFRKYREDYRIEEILSAGNVAGELVKRAREAEFDERLSLVGLLLDALCGDMKKLNDTTRVLACLRDALREVSVDAKEGKDSAALLSQQALERQSQLEMRLAAGTISADERNLLQRVIGQLQTCERLARRGLFGDVEAHYAKMVAALEPQVEKIEGRIAHAFDFVEAAFGDKQEMLIFTTELTSRSVSARYIAQYGSDAYYRHNENMILSDRQRELRRRVEELNL